MCLPQVEVALFFQQEVLREAAPGSSSANTGSAAASTAAASSSGRGPLTAASFPALLLSGDNAQVQTARSHGLPAARMVDVAAAQRQLEAALQRQPQQPLTASLLRTCLGVAAVTGAGCWLAVVLPDAVAGNGVLPAPTCGCLAPFAPKPVWAV